MHPFSNIDVNNTAAGNKLTLDDSTGVDQTLERLDNLSSRIFYFCESKHQLIPSPSVANSIKSVLTNFVKFISSLEEDVEHDYDLYVFCRSSLGAMIESVGIVMCNDGAENLLSLNDIFQFVIEIASELCTELAKTAGSN
ncbi:hypothetical protein P3L10_033973 [Capsicum annuum]